METLPRDIVSVIALELDLPDILNYCLSKSNFNICNNESFWIRKLDKDFRITYNKGFGSAKKYYLKKFNERINEAKQEYAALVSIAERVQSIKPQSHLALPNGMRLYRINVKELLEQWRNSFSDIINIIGKDKFIPLYTNIDNLLVYKSDYEDESEEVFDSILNF